MTDTAERAAHKSLVSAVMDLYEVNRILDAVCPVPKGASAVALQRVFGAASKSKNLLGEHDDAK